MKGNWRSDLGLLILRLGIGLIALYYGSQKALGLFHGGGIHDTVAGMEAGYGIPPVFALLAIAGEFAGALGMIVGLLTPVAAFGFACVMAVATYVNWKGPGIADAVMSGSNADKATHGLFTLPLFAGAVALLLCGGGAYSLDAMLFSKNGRNNDGKKTTKKKRGS